MTDMIRCMRRFPGVITCLLLMVTSGAGQSASFSSYMNPVIPGDHPDCTVTRVGNDFYTTGSSFNVTPVIYHSTDLVHWEAIAQPVSSSWSNYGDTPAGGCWGGQIVYYKNVYWHFFSRANTMYFVTAADPKRAWTLPTAMSCPPSVPGLGYDNSIFIDDDGKWYLLVKNGQVNNWIVQLGDDGQPAGAILNLCWINPAPSYPYSWAEGPVMWKFRGYYYYSFARNVAGGQRVFRSSTFTDNQASWTDLGDFFNESDPLKAGALFQNPNHSSAAVMLNDSTHWVVHPLWRNANNNEWYGQGRQGLLNQVRYDANGRPTADYPTNIPRTAPDLPSSGIPWMVPHTDLFTASTLHPEWSFLGYTPAHTWSVSLRPGWLSLLPKGKINTVVKNDGEHNYALITRVDVQPKLVTDQAGLWIFNGLQTVDTRLYCSIDSAGKRIVGFSYKTTAYRTPAPGDSAATITWLKLVRVNHVLSGYCSDDGYHWTPVGGSISVTDMDNQQPNYNAWTGNRQGLFVQGIPADFDLYIYRDAYTPILAECPANQYGTTVMATRNNVPVLAGIDNNDWALYAGVELGPADYRRAPDSLQIIASCGSAGGAIEAWLDSIGSGTKIAECTITSTGSYLTYQSFTTHLLAPVSGMHDLYLRFKGTGADELFQIQWIIFLGDTVKATSVREEEPDELPLQCSLGQNYPNPFNPSTVIPYQLATGCVVDLDVFDLLGRRIATLVHEYKPAGSHRVEVNGLSMYHASGSYYYRLRAGNVVQVRTMTLIR